MTDPKLVEKAKEFYGSCSCGFIEGFSWDGNHGANCVINRLVSAFQSHGDQVRIKTVEECAKLLCKWCLNDVPFASPGFLTGEHELGSASFRKCEAFSIRKLLEVK